jgi:hypothetical protein
MGAALFEKESKLTPLLRYPYLISWTILLLLKNKARIIFVQNPSLILSFFTVFLGKIILKKHVIVDAHNIALEPITGFWAFLEKIRVFVIRNATFTIVSNSELTNRITLHEGSPLVLADPLPKFHRSSAKYNLTGKYNVLYICSWADDEPYCEVLKAASLLDDSIKLYISGSHKRKYSSCLSTVPHNVVLTGFLKENEFEYILHTVDAIMDLTSRDSCLLCGAYEGVAAEKPMVLSNTEALRTYFYKGVVYTDNTAADIAEKINLVLSDQKYHSAVVEMKNEIGIKWEKDKDKVNNAIESLDRPHYI